jgi:hypothetical protein
MKCAELQNRDIGTGHQIKAIYERPTFACVKEKWSLLWSAMANSIADAGGRSSGYERIEEVVENRRRAG